MNRMLLGGLAALLMVAAGLFWWQGRAATEKGAPPPSLAGDPATPPVEDALPFADAAGRRGAAPPQLDPVSREQRRFDRLDRDRDGRITANEMLAPRAAAFRKLDADHNNLLTFQEWSVRTGNRFSGADRNGDGALTRDEFATTKPKPGKRPACRCDPRPKNPARPAPADDDLAGDGGEPAE